MLDLRCGAQRILKTIRVKIGHYPYQGDIYMSKNRKRVQLVHFENNAFHLHEKQFKKGYRFMKFDVDVRGQLLYSMSWKNLVALLEYPLLDILQIRSDILASAI